METKIAILRGINVGGKRKILMADLKSMFLGLGFTQVLTYIQSGNIIFKSPEVNNSKLETILEQSIKSKFGFNVLTIVCSLKELENNIKSNPFYTKEADVNKLYLTLLKTQPKAKNKKQLENLNAEPDKFAITNHHVFIYCEGKYHQSKLTNNFIEKKLAVTATTRNWKTILKLIELSKA